MKIAKVEALHCDGGWRPWTFVRVETDTGIVGWGECSDNRSPYGIAGSVRDMADLLIGQDPRPVERLYWDMLRATRQNLGGVTHKAIAGIELALWDIKAKALGVPVYELFGGPLRDRMRLYWSHCGTTRARLGHVLGTPPLRSYADIAALGKEVVARGFTALKTNMVIPGDPATVYFPGFASGINSTDGAPTDWVATLRDTAGHERNWTVRIYGDGTWAWFEGAALREEGTLLDEGFAPYAQLISFRLNAGSDPAKLAPPFDSFDLRNGPPDAPLLRYVRQ